VAATARLTPAGGSYWAIMGSPVRAPRALRITVVTNVPTASRADPIPAHRGIGTLTYHGTGRAVKVPGSTPTAMATFSRGPSPLSDASNTGLLVLWASDIVHCCSEPSVPR